MNTRAAELGARGTHFANPHGLHAANHYSTARDLATIAAHAMSLPEFGRVVAIRSIALLRPAYTQPTDPSGKAVKGQPRVRKLERRLFTNRNRLLFRWDACDGIKTGYTRHAGRCLAASSTQRGWQAIAVVLKAQDPWTDCRTLLEWAFASHEKRDVVQQGQELGQVAVRDGKARSVTAVASQALAVVVPRDAPTPAFEVRALDLTAPVQSGEKVGTAQVVDAGTVRGEVALVASTDVPLSTWGQLKRLSLPKLLSQGILCLAAGVLLLGTAAKATRTRRRVLATRRRGADPRRQSNGGRADRARAGYQGRPGEQRDRG